MAASGNVRTTQIRSGDRSGTGAKVATVTGTLTTGKQLEFDASGNVVASSTAIGGGGTENAPLVADFTAFNTGSLTATDTAAGLYMRNVENDSELHGLVKSAPGTPYTITINFRYFQLPETNKYPFVGLLFSDGTKYVTLSVYNNSGGPLNKSQWISVDHWNSATSYSSSPLPAVDIGESNDLYSIRISDDGTNRKYYYSFDGVNFEEAYSEGRTVHLTATQVGLVVRTNSSSTQIVSMTVSSWVAA